MAHDANAFSQYEATACSKNFNISSACTNTIYTDSNGNTEGATIFVSTDCHNGERLTGSQQDSVYEDQGLSVPAYAELTNDTYDNWEDTDMNFLTQDPSGWPTCERRCLCGYANVPLSNYDPLYSYGFRNCTIHLPLVYLTIAFDIFVTQANISILQFYGIYINESVTIFSTSNITMLSNVSEGVEWFFTDQTSETIYKPVYNPYECFGVFPSIQVAFNSSGANNTG